mgnify:CR=1 FL=1
MIKLDSFIRSFLVMFFIFNCSCQSNYNWKVYDSTITGLKFQHEGFNELIVSDTAFYLLGSFNESLKWKDKLALVYKSENKGKTWLNNLKEEGNVNKGYYSSEGLFLIKEIYLENSFKNSCQSLLKLDKNLSSCCCRNK